MPHYLHQVAYTSESWKALVAQPQNRVEVVSHAIEKLGGKVVAGFFAFGEYDIIVITEMPDSISAAAIAIAFAAGGACKSVQTTPLLSPEEALQALKKAGESGYRPLPRAA
jgi:uncharacterized protein with GYD domain